MMLVGYLKKSEKFLIGYFHFLIGFNRQPIVISIPEDGCTMGGPLSAIQSGNSDMYAGYLRRRLQVSHDVLA